LQFNKRRTCQTKVQAVARGPVHSQSPEGESRRGRLRLQDHGRNGQQRNKCFHNKSAVKLVVEVSFLAVATESQASQVM
jgi:hypothetical protein